MRAAIIGAGAEALHSIGIARKLGVETIALDGNPSAEGLEAADEGIQVDISDEKAVMEALSLKKPDFVLTVPIGRYLTTIGAVNDAFGLKGVSGQAAVNCTDKYRFHSILSERGLRNCHCYLVNAAEADTLSDRVRSDRTMLSYPAILKPRYGSGSRGMFFICNHRELDAALGEAVLGAADYVLEEIFPGEEFGVDAAVIEGHFEMILLRKKLITPLPARQAVGYLSVVPGCEEGLYRRITNFMKEVTEVLGILDCLLHADILIHQEAVSIIELSARPSGHNLHNLFTPLATGVDMAEEFIKYQLGERYSFQPAYVKQMMIRYFDFENCVLREAPETKSFDMNNGVELVRWNCRMRSGEYLEKVTNGHSIMGRGYFILEGKSEKELTDKAGEILGSFQFQ